MSIEAMKLALEALELEAAGWDGVSPVTRDAIIALLAAIEEAEKPWVKTYSEGKPQYTTPEDPRQWQGLTDEELREAYLAIRGNEWCLGGISDAESFYEAIEAKLKEKNT